MSTYLDVNLGFVIGKLILQVLPECRLVQAIHSDVLDDAHSYPVPGLQEMTRTRLRMDAGRQHSISRASRLYVTASQHAGQRSGHPEWLTQGAPGSCLSQFT